MIRQVFLIKNPGIYTLIQDGGRVGYRSFGVPISGALDEKALNQANYLVNNPKGYPGLEILSTGMELLALADCYVAFTGALATILVDKKVVKTYETLLIKKGQTIIIKTLKSGLRTYLGVHGGFVSDVIMGSVSINEQILIGSRLKRDEVLSTCKPFTDVLIKTIKKPVYDNHYKVILGPDNHKFSSKEIKKLFNNSYEVTNKLSRMGINLLGEKISHINGADVLSHPVMFGSIQIPANGQPIILLADGQTTGGYAVIGNICGDDLYKLGQTKAGDIMTFSRSK
ncbi:MAG: biotin-dependent carboxyltransferase family protein [Clostridiales bacterium]|nr:biotin-dependent carboxyltransferase family protein [Clostridiales bacterium]